MHIVLYQPDIPQNTGTILRLAACLGIKVHIIEPAGFVWSDKTLKRAGMDYLNSADIVRHNSAETFFRDRPGGRLVLLSTRATEPYTSFRFEESDQLLLGRESAGVPQDVHDRADFALCIPMAGNMRSLNVAIAAAMVTGEALRQTGGFPPLNA